MPSYNVARSHFNTLQFLAWLIIICGLILMIAGLAGTSEIGGGFSRRGPGFVVYAMAALPGGAMALFGFLFLVGIQIGRATVDTAEYTLQMLTLSREQTELARKAADHNPTIRTSLDIPIEHLDEMLSEIEPMFDNQRRSSG